ASVLQVHAWRGCDEATASICLSASNDARLMVYPPARWSFACSTEREGEGLDIRILKHDLELPVAHRPRLAGELIQPLLRYGAVSLGVEVAAMRVPGRLSIDQDAKPDRGASHCWSSDEV